MKNFNKKKKSINWLLLLAIMAATVWYGNYINENQYMYKQLEVFSRIRDFSQDDSIIHVSSSAKTGYIRPQIVDGFSEKPIEGAIVVVPATNQQYKTDKKGYTPDIQIPIDKDPNFEKIHPKSWGETTLIVYKEGYREYVLLNLNIWESQARIGPKILLFEYKDKEFEGPMAIVDGPNQLWVNSLVDKYRP